MVEKMDVVALAFMVVGIIFLFQPLSKTLFTLGFPLLLITYFLHSILDHL